MTKKEYLAFHKAQCERMIEITQKKNADYSGAGDDPFNNFRHIKNFVNTPGAIELGFLTRMTDKFSRIGSFIANGTLQVKDESVQDTLLDLANYAILFMGLLEENKQKAETEKILEEYKAGKRRYPPDGYSGSASGCSGGSGGDGSGPRSGSLPGGVPDPSPHKWGGTGRIEFHGGIGNVPSVASRMFDKEDS